MTVVLGSKYPTYRVGETDEEAILVVTLRAATPTRPVVTTVVMFDRLSTWKLVLRAHAVPPAADVYTETRILGDGASTQMVYVA